MNEINFIKCIQCHAIFPDKQSFMTHKTLEKILMGYPEYPFKIIPEPEYNIGAI